jgi:hypothetical protein
MASATLKLTIEPATGKRTVTISYASDEDALPHEHEEAHRALVEKILERGTPSKADTIVVERDEAPPTTTADTGDAREEARAKARGSG